MTHDLTDLGPTFACICGETAFKMLVIWDQETRQPGAWDSWMYCSSCDARCYAPTPIDEV